MKGRFVFIFVIFLILSISHLGRANLPTEFWSDALDQHGTIMLMIEAETGAIIRANQSAGNFYGYSVSELQDMHIQDINALPSSDVQQELTAAAREDQNHFQFTHRLANGDQRTVEVYAWPIDQEGAFVLSIINDITRRLAAENKLLDYNQRLARAERITKLGHWEFHLGENRVVASPGAEAIYGLNSDQLTIEATQQIPLPEYRDLLDQALVDLVENKEPYDVTFQIKRPSDGEIVDIHSLAEYDSERNVVFGTLLDVTEQNRALATVREQRDWITIIGGLFLLSALIGILVMLRLLKLRKRAQQDQQELNSELSERLRELKCLNDITSLIATHQGSYLQLFQRIAYQIPYGLHCPGISCARITLPEQEFESLSDSGSHQIYTTQIPVRGIPYGSIEIYCTNPQEALLPQEKEMLSTIGRYLGILVERQAAEEQLHRQEQDLQITLQSIGDAVIATDTEGRVTRMNRVCEKLTGWSATEAMGRPLTDVFNIINSQTREPASNPVSKVLANGEVVGLANHTSLIAKDNTEYHIADSAAPIVDDQGNIQGVILVFHDVTEEYLARQSIERSEERFRGLFAHSISGMSIHEVITDNQGKPLDCRFLQVNQAFEKITGFTAEQVVGKTLSQISPDLQKLWLEKFGNRSDSSGVVHEEYIPGLNKHFEIKVYSLEPNQAVSVVNDITDRKSSQEKLEQWHRLMQFIIHHDPSAIAVYDKDLHHVYVSQRYLDDYGVQEQDVIGKHHYQVFPEIPDKWKEVHQRVLNGAVEKGEDPFVRLDGRIDYTRWECHPWYKADGTIGGMILYSEVITKRKQAEEALRQSEEYNRSIIELIPDTLTRYSADGECLDIIPSSVTERKNRVHDQLVGKKISEVFPDDVSNSLMEAIDAALDTKTLQTVEY